MSAGSRILLVEDHADTAWVTARLLQQEGYDVHVACSYNQALSVASSDGFDLLICDCRLPDGDGGELMRVLRSSFHIKGIAITGSVMPAKIDGLKEAGFSCVLIKPIVFSALVAAMNKLFPASESTTTANAVERPTV